MLAAVTIDAVYRNGIRHVQLARAKSAFFHVVAVDGVEDDRVEPDRFRVPVGRALLHANAIV